MNSEYTPMCGSEAIGSPGTPVSDGKVSTPTSEKRRVILGTMGIISGVALTLGLTSCLVGPYDGYSQGYTTIHSTGHSIHSLPRGYRSETISGRTYYYHDGHYYRPGSGGYVVVEAPRTSRYYDDYSRFQRPQERRRGHRQSAGRRDSRYDHGQVITRLPPGYREINHRGNTYYQAGDRYYSRQGGGYVVVNRPY